MKAMILLDVPEWQIGQEVTVHFPDTMMKKAKCEVVQTVIPSLTRDWYVCECGTYITVCVDGEPLHKQNYCPGCGRGLIWE